MMCEAWRSHCTSALAGESMLILVFPKVLEVFVYNLQHGYEQRRAQSQAERSC